MVNEEIEAMEKGLRQGEPVVAIENHIT